MTDPITTHSDYSNLTDWWQTKLEAAVQPTEALWWQSRLGAIGETVEDGEDLRQAIAIIIKTPQGSDCHRPEFASNVWNFIDYPVPRATPYVVRETLAAIETWEPRLAVENVAVLPYEPGMAGLTVSVEWSVAEEDTQTTEVTVG